MGKRRKHSAGFNYRREDGTNYVDRILDPSKGDGCYGKWAYETEDEARAVASAHSSRSGRRIDVYLCPICGLYHLTSAK